MLDVEAATKVLEAEDFVQVEEELRRVVGFSEFGAELFGSSWGMLAQSKANQVVKDISAKLLEHPITSASVTAMKKKLTLTCQECGFSATSNYAEPLEITILYRGTKVTTKAGSPMRHLELAIAAEVKTRAVQDGSLEEIGPESDLCAGVGDRQMGSYDADMITPYKAYYV